MQRCAGISNADFNNQQPASPLHCPRTTLPLEMSSVRPHAFQALLRGRSPMLRVPQKRFARVHDVRFLATHRDPNQVQDKYKEKLDQKAKQ